MARPKREKPVKLRLESQGETEESSQAESREGSLFDGLQTDGYVNLHRLDDITKKWVYHGRLTPAEATEEHIAGLYGGGTYRCQERVPEPSGRITYGRTRTVVISGPYKPPREPVAAEAKPATSPAASPAPAMMGGNVGDVLSAGVLQLFQASAAQQQMMMQMFSQMQAQQATLMQAVLQGEKKPGLESLLAAAAPIVTAYLSQPKQERDPLEMIRAITDIVKPVTGQQGNMADFIGAMREMLELKDMLSGNTESDPVGKLVESVPGIVDVLKTEQQLRAQARTTTPNGGVPVKQVPTKDASIPQVQMPLWERVLRNDGKKLVMAAQFNRDPGLVAEAALEFAPDAVKPAVAEFFASEDAKQRVLAIIPEMKPYEMWLDSFLEEARALLTPEEDEGATATPEEGHADQPEG